MNVIESILHSLAASSTVGDFTSLPTFLIQGSSVSTGRAEDKALAYYLSQGFEGDRTYARLNGNCNGYPRLLRDLSNPPPWVKVTMDDMDDDISEERMLELCPLIQYVQRYDEEALITLYRSEQKRAASASAFVDNLIGIGETERTIPAQAGEQKLRQCIALAKAIGIAFNSICEAVFAFDCEDSTVLDDFAILDGVPDLLLWLPNHEPPVWFFSEVKAPGDYLSSNQKAWAHTHWELVQGHYAITMLE